MGREEERGLVRLGAAADEEGLLLARDRGEGDQLLRQLDLVLDQVKRRGVKDLVRLLFTASAISGTACPLMVVTIPPKKSRYSFPSESQTLKPSPRASSSGFS